VVTTAESAQRPGAASGGLVARHPLLVYSILAYGISWLVWLPLLLSQDGLGLLTFHSPLGVLETGGIATFGPFLGALIVTSATEGRAGIRRWLQLIVLWRVGLRWYLLALVGLPVVQTLGTLAVPGNLASFEPMDPLALLGTYLVSFIWPALIIGGPLGEEPGWRGFALPRLQRQYGPFVGTLILAPLWTFWHVPVWLTAWTAAGMLNVYTFVLYLLFISAWTFIYTWIANNTRGSVLMAILVHASVDAFPNFVLWPLFPASLAVTSYGVYFGYYGLVVGLGIMALLIVALTRGDLGNHRYRREVGEARG
jgi:membrane protease YdiL (CAAX protease family)